MNTGVKAVKTSNAGIALIKRFEGIVLKAYLDIAGVPTIGYGHTETVTRGDVERGRALADELEAHALLVKDLGAREAQLKGWSISTGVILNQNEWDALISFIYNLGFDAFRGSTAARRLMNGDRLGAADALTWWNKASVGGVMKVVAGLTRRRAAEKALFLERAAETPNDPDADGYHIDQDTRMAAVEGRPSPFGWKA